MRKTRFLSVVPLLLAPIPVWAQLPTDDSRFVAQAMAGGQQEVAAGQLAETKAGRAEVRVFGRWMATDHTLIGKVLSEHSRPAGAAASVTSPDPTVNALSQLSGSEFDAGYLGGQVTGHQRMIALFEQEAASGQNATLRSIAQDVLPALREHLAEARRLQGMPAGAPAVQQTSAPNAAPAANAAPTTSQSPNVGQMAAQGKKRVEVEGK